VPERGPSAFRASSEPGVNGGPGTSSGTRACGHARATVPETERGERERNERERGGEALLLLRTRLDGTGGGDVCTCECVGLGGGTEGGSCESGG
jgi:hypothetical protein